jgi:hypothetical protein
MAAAALLSAGCAMDFDNFEPGPDGSAPDAAADGAKPSDSGAAGDAVGVGTDASACSGANVVTCLVCQDGGPPTVMCSPASSTGSCLSGQYSHCPCMQDSDCPGATERCSNNQCTVCGEPLFNQAHTRCTSGGNCCKTGSTIGQCTC